VATFVGLNVYTYASQHRQTPEPHVASATNELTSVTIPVEGMTCFTCELTVESSLKDLPGVQQVDAKVNEQAAHVRYDPSRVGLEALIAAITQTGFQAKPPNETAQP
jgi:copper chaperone CopZ